jgi:hypothetical protein
MAYGFRILKSNHDVRRALSSISIGFDASDFNDAPRELEPIQEVRGILRQLLRLLRENEKDLESKPLAPI